MFLWKNVEKKSALFYVKKYFINLATVEHIDLTQSVIFEMFYCGRKKRFGFFQYLKKFSTTVGVGYIRLVYI